MLSFSYRPLGLDLLFLSAVMASRNAHDIMNAIEQASPEEIEALITAGSDANDSRDGATTLTAAAFLGRVDVLHLLIEHGANVHAKRENGTSALHEATLCDSQSDIATKDKIIDILRQAGLDIDTADEDGNTALHLATLSGSLDIVQLLVEKGADVNARTIFNDTPLDRACLEGHLDVVEFLISKGAELNSNAGSCNGISLAAGNGQSDTVKFLVAKGAEPQSKGSGVELLDAARNRNADLVSFLMNNGYQDQAPKALMQAILIDSLEVIALLVDVGVDLSMKGKNQQSVLHYAVLAKKHERSNSHGVINPRTEVIKYLISKGADISLVNADGKTALDLARDIHYREAVTYFQAQLE